MATPTGPRARAARGWYSRERRRRLQNQKDFEIAGYTPAAPFNFGATALGGSSANAMTLPADIDIALELASATVAGDMGVEDVSGSATYVQAEAAAAGARVNIRKTFREARQIRIARGATAPAGTVSVYFRGPKSQLVKIGEATFT